MIGGLGSPKLPDAIILLKHECRIEGRLGFVNLGVAPKIQARDLSTFMRVSF